MTVVFANTPLHPPLGGNYYRLQRDEPTFFCSAFAEATARQARGELLFPLIIPYLYHSLLQTRF
jgi:hypothetical protein